MEQRKYILGIDQSTQGTKALIFDEHAALIARADVAHRQLISEEGWISHDLNEIYTNVNAAVKSVVEKAGINKDSIIAVGITNQRETTAIWNKKTGEPLDLAVVWQCDRAKHICNEINSEGYADRIREYTGLPLSPYFPAAKMRWLLDTARKKSDLSKENICLGTIDSWLVFKLTKGVFRTDYSNASRTQLFNIHTLEWDKELCDIFGIPRDCLAEVSDSDANYGSTDFEGFLSKKIPILAVLGDSHAALYGQGCNHKGMVKATYGTGSSIMMNIGEHPVLSKHGVVTSLAWSINGKINYVLEGNINYAGAIVSWLKDDLKLIEKPEETEYLAMHANDNDETYFVPAFSGLGAPYWKSDVAGMIYGMKRYTGRAEIVKAGIDSIAYQVNDIIEAMEEDVTAKVLEIRADGGITSNKYLMQFQCDISNTPVLAADIEALSGFGAALAAGTKAGLYSNEKVEHINYKIYRPKMDEEVRLQKKTGWKNVISFIVNK